MTSPNPPQASYRSIGWLLALPALLGTLITLVLPTAQTIWLSFQSGGAITAHVFAGTENYADLLGGSRFWQVLGFTASLVGLPLLVSVVVAPLLALALDRGGAWPRRAGRVVLALAIVTFSPVGVAAGWVRALRAGAASSGATSSGPLGLSPADLADPATAPGAVRLIVAAATFGVVCAVAVTAYLPALRGGAPTTAMLVVGVLVALATLAAGLQTFAIGTVLTQGGPRYSTATLAFLEYDNAFRLARFGPGASVATVIGALLGVLGIAATVVAVAARLRITLTRPAPAPAPAPAAAAPAAAGPAPAGEAAPGTVPGRRPGAAAVAVAAVALVLFAAVGVLLAWPWISGVLAGAPGTAAQAVQDGLRVQINTWVPATAGALVSVGVAYLAALGIGGLRPLGRRSEWLLLIFAPWLFVGTGTLGVANWQTLRNLGLIDTFLALVPPLLVSVPALFVLTLLCKGLAERDGGRDFFGGVVLPSLPMAGILAGAVTLVNAQDLLWPLLVVQEPGLFTATAAQAAQLGGFAAALPDVGLTTPLAVVVLALAAAVAAQLLYLDRLAIATKGTPAGAANGSRPRVTAA
ncbi:sugar ABC transporter permease [Actinomadura sp. ATCC 31491]|uniref:Sugar ABC transporter permease n=1 Tax=Actinomadura luzonensis TaxID=2805427 RepID=A0ABT0FWJ5_9ACTN|nr:sugar ABC transporter permease [Actinomadura luzonensis]MCK2216716.1 sugar ABC transporter permease [Actinomadura luzonensis]